jgi:peptide deformylase
VFPLTRSGTATLPEAHVRSSRSSILPDPVLREVSKPVERVDAPSVTKLAGDMLETMYDAPGHRARRDPDRRAAAHAGDRPRQGRTRKRSRRSSSIPRSCSRSDDERSTYEEGCLSIPDYYAEVERPATVTVAYHRLDGKSRDRGGGLLATCLQHEIDHLNGVLFIDHISRLKRDMVVRRFKKLAKDRQPQVG